MCATISYTLKCHLENVLLLADPQDFLDRKINIFFNTHNIYNKTQRNSYEKSDWILEKQLCARVFLLFLNFFSFSISFFLLSLPPSHSFPLLHFSVFLPLSLLHSRSILHKNLQSVLSQISTICHGRQIKVKDLRDAQASERDSLNDESRVYSTQKQNSQTNKQLTTESNKCKSHFGRIFIVIVRMMTEQDFSKSQSLNSYVIVFCCINEQSAKVQKFRNKNWLLPDIRVDFKIDQLNSEPE